MQHVKSKKGFGTIYQDINRLIDLADKTPERQKAVEDLVHFYEDPCYNTHYACNRNETNHDKYEDNDRFWLTYWTTVCEIMLHYK